MSYDADSFKAGFALGRMLWRPPQNTNVTPGIVWTADPQFLIYAAGTIYCENSGTRTPYVKSSRGQAICVIITNANANEAGGHWTWPYLISTDSDATKSSRPSAGINNAVTFTYLGLTWYCRNQVAYNQSWGGSTDVVSDWPIFDWDGEQAGIINGTPMLQSTFERIMSLANVRLVE